MHRGIATALATRISSTWKEPYRSGLLRRRQWTEYALYFRYAEYFGLLETHYAPGGIDTILRLTKSLWQPPDQYLKRRDCGNWKVSDVFDPQGDGIAVVVQSYLHYPIQEVAHKIRRFLR